MDRDYIRANLFGVLLGSLFDFLREHHLPVAQQILQDILLELLRAAKANKVTQQQFLDSLEPELTRYCAKLDRLGRKRPRKWKTLTEGERQALILRYLMFFNLDSSKVISRQQFSKINRRVAPKICTEPRLRKETVAGAMIFIAKCCLSDKERKEVFDYAFGPAKKPK